MGNQFAGRNLAVTIGGTAVPCPQSVTVTPSQDIYEYYCTGASGKQKILLGTAWSGSCIFFPEDNDQADITSFNTTTAAAVIVYPDGNTNGSMKITFSAYCSTGLDLSVGSAGSSTVNFMIDGDVTFGSATGS